MLKIGEYIRTPYGKIGKITDIPKHNPYFDDGFILDNKHFIECGRNAMKELNSTPNIIDLIQEGDILKINDFKDVYTIYEVEMFRNPYTNEKYLGIRNDFGKKPKRLYEIPLVNLSIVTKEKYESIEYRTGE